MNLLQLNNVDSASVVSHYGWRRDSQLKPFDEMIIDSEKVLDRAIKNGIQLKSVLTTKQHLDRNQEMLATLGATPIYIASQQQISEAVGNRVHHGIMAIANRPPDPNLDTLGNRIVILDRIYDSQNVGVIARNCHAFGFQDAFIIGGASPYVRRAIRVSMGSCFVLRIRHINDEASLLQTLLQNEYSIISSHIGDDAVELTEHSRPDKCAIVLGNEESGISKGILDLSDGKVSIGMNAGIDSLGVAAASAVVLHHFS